MTVLPLTVQTLDVVEVKLTARPEVAVALTVLVPPTAKALGVKLMAPMVWLNATPVPLKLKLFGLEGALLVMLIAPFLLPPADGVKITLKLHEPPAPRPEPQLFVTPKSPLAVMLLILSAAPPVLFSAIV